MDAGHEGVDFFFRVIKGKRGADGAGDAETVHQGLCTMMTRADGNAEAVE